MGKNAAFRGFARSRPGLIALASLATGALLLACLADTAAARGPVGKDGKIHACYRVKGKPKGALRVVRNARTRCRRGERRVSWRVAASAQPGGSGSQGAQGQPGASSSTSSDEAALKAQIGALALRVQELESILPSVEALCKQSEELTKQVNLIAEVVEGLGLSPALEALGFLDIPSLPEALEPFSCPA